MATLALNIIGNPTSALKALSDVDAKAQKTSAGVHSSFGKLAGVLGGVFAGAGIVGFLHSANDEAVESQKVGAQTAAVLKSTGDAAKVSATEVGNLATAISNKAGIDDEAIQSGENLLLTFTGIRNEAGAGNDIFNQATSIMTDMSVAMGQDMKSSAVQLGKALNDPAKGMTALTRVGVTFTDQQKEQIESMEKAGDTAGAQKVILNELKREFGGSAAAQATSAQKAQVAFKNLEEQVGTALMPIISALANFLTQHVIPTFSAIVSWVQRNADLIKTLALVLSPLIAAWAGYAAVTKVVSVAQAALNLVMTANPIGLVVAALVGLVAIFVVAWRHSETFRRIVTGALNAVTGAFTAAWGWIREHWPLLLGILTGPIGLAIGFIVKHWDGVVDFFKKIPGRIASAAHGMWDFIVDEFKGIINAVTGLWNSFVGHLNIHINKSMPWPLPDIHVNLDIGDALKIPMLAEGGIVTRPMLAMIGEAGPEAVVPLSAGRRGGGGAPTQINVTINGATRDGVREFDQALRRLYRETGGQMGYA